MITIMFKVCLLTSMKAIRYFWIGVPGANSKIRLWESGPITHSQIMYYGFVIIVAFHEGASNMSWIGGCRHNTAYLLNGQPLLKLLLIKHRPTSHLQLWGNKSAKKNILVNHDKKNFKIILNCRPCHNHEKLIPSGFSSSESWYVNNKP